MSYISLWTTILVVFHVGWCGVVNNLEDQIIKVYVEATAPKNIKVGKVKLEYEFSSECDDVVSHKLSDYKDCDDVPLTNGSGVYMINMDGVYKPVYCEVTSQGPNFLVIQKRFNGKQDFYRNWSEYEGGFGNVSDEFWLGLEAIHKLTTHTGYKLRIEMEANDSTKAYADYSTFSVGPSSTKYILNVSGYSGTAGDSLSYHDGQKFSTFDQDNDEYGPSCAVEFKGAWWYKNCHESNLNGFYYGGPHQTYADGIDWFKFKGHNESMKAVTMKIYKAAN